MALAGDPLRGECVDIVNCWVFGDAHGRQNGRAAMTACLSMVGWTKHDRYGRIVGKVMVSISVDSWELSTVAGTPQCNRLAARNILSIAHYWPDPNADSKCASRNCQSNSNSASTIA